MRVLMLGWEFPPFISGGLGTACYGLTKALSGIGQDVMFVLPRPVAAPFSTHVKLVSAPQGSALASPPADYRYDEFERVHFQTVQTNETNEPATGTLGHTPDASLPPQPFWNGPYDRPRSAEPESSVGKSNLRGSAASSAPASFAGSSIASSTGPFVTPHHAPPRTVSKIVEERVREIRATALQPPARASNAGFDGGAGDQGEVGGGPPTHDSHYAGDLFAEVQRYAQLATEVARKESFDVIHAHDWMTYPAGLAVAAATGKPLVVHVHSTEFDRAGLHVDQRIYDIERRGMHAAVKVIAVSHLTKNFCVHHYGVEPDNIEVVHNAIEFPTGNGNGANSAGYDTEKYKIHEHEKIVLFLGRITLQKGPEYFLAAAKKVLEVMPNVKFVMAGSGDLVRRTIEMAAQLGIGHKVLFTGFLRGADVERVFKMADLYVMPSVSEPFGIAPLEAMSNDVPVIISKQSGVSEVLKHALKVDFWDVGEMANKIVAVLRHPPLSASLKKHGSFEVKKLSWTDAAKACVHVYESAIAAMPVVATSAHLEPAVAIAP